MWKDLKISSLILYLLPSRGTSQVCGIMWVKNIVLQLPSNLIYCKIKASGSICPGSYDSNVVLTGRFLYTEYIFSDIPYLEALASAFLVFFFFFFNLIHLLMRNTHTQRERERGRDTGRGRSSLHAGSLMWDSIPELLDHALSKRQTQPLSHPGIPRAVYF